MMYLYQLTNKRQIAQIIAIDGESAQRLAVHYLGDNTWLESEVKLLRPIKNICPARFIKIGSCK